MQIGPVSVQPMYPLRQATQVQSTDRTANATEGRPGSSVIGGAAYVEEARSARGRYSLDSTSGTRAAGRQASASEQAKQTDLEPTPNEPQESETTGTQGVAPTAPNGEPLMPEELVHLEQLKVTDRAVRQHEMAHQIVGGAYAGGASYEYEIGPDGKHYAIAGEVSIDYGAVKGDPQATIEKMEKVIAAALAPVDPSVQDRKVAAMARQTLLSARLELAQLQNEMNAARGEINTVCDEPPAPVERTFMAGQPAAETLRVVA